MYWPFQAKHPRGEFTTNVNGSQGQEKTTPVRSGVVENSRFYVQLLLVLFLCDDLLADLDEVHAGVLYLLHHAPGHRVEIVVEQVFAGLDRQRRIVRVVGRVGVGLGYVGDCSRVRDRRAGRTRVDCGDDGERFSLTVGQGANRPRGCGVRSLSRSDRGDGEACGYQIVDGDVGSRVRAVVRNRDRDRFFRFSITKTITITK